jgi:DNA-binding transcriptional LysR family regulator
VLVWDDLRYILAVRRHGSLARAAKALALNKSTVSRRLAAIEEELGVALMQRGPHGYELTEAGEAATAMAERIERLVNELVAAVGGSDRTARGTVRITVPAWFAQHVLIPGLADFRATHPGLDVHLITTDEVLDLGRREADIGMRNVRPTQQSLIVRKGCDIDFAMYASREYIARHGMPRDRTDLAAHQLIAYRDAVAYVEAYRWSNELSDRVAFRASDATSMLDAVAAGLGIGVLPCFLAARAPDVVCLESVGGPQPEVIWLVTHPDTAGIERVRIVMAWLTEQLARYADTLTTAKTRAKGGSAST